MMIEHEIFHHKYLKKSIKKIFIEFIKDTSVFLFYISIIYLIFTILLYGLKFLWLSYTETYVGKAIVNNYEDFALVIESIFSKNLWIHNIYLYLSSIIVLLAIAVISKFILLKNYLYDHINKLARLFIWIIPLSILSAILFNTLVDYYDIVISSVLCFIPVLFLCDISMKYISDIIPDLVDIKYFFINIFNALKQNKDQIKLV